MPFTSPLLCCHGAAPPYPHNLLSRSLLPALLALVEGIHFGGKGVLLHLMRLWPFPTTFLLLFTGTFSEGFPSARASDSCCANDSTTAADEPPSSSREERGRSRVAMQPIRRRQITQRHLWRGHKKNPDHHTCSLSSAHRCNSASPLTDLPQQTTLIVALGPSHRWRPVLLV